MKRALDLGALATYALYLRSQLYGAGWSMRLYFDTVLFLLSKRYARRHS